MNSSKLRLEPVALIVLAASVLSYANGISEDFTYDDKAIIRDNPRIESLRRLPEIFTTHYFGGKLATGTAYRPVTLVSYAVNHAVHGRFAAGYHAVNLALHVAVSLLLLGILRELRFPETVAGGASLLFALAPIHAEAVTSLVGRAELLSALFVLLMLRSARRGGRAAPAVFYLLAIFTKESAVIAPGLLLLADALEEPGSLLARCWRLLLRRPARYFVHAVPLFVYLGARFAVLRGFLISRYAGVFELENPLVGLGPVARVGNAALVQLRYLGRMLFPLYLSADESAWALPIVSPREWLFWAGLVALCALLLLSVARFGGRPEVAFGFLLFFLTGLPTANYLFVTGTVMAERLMYLPSAGIAVAAAAVCCGRWRRWEEVPRGALACLFGVAALFGARTIIRNSVWRNDSALFSNMVRTVPGSAKAHYNYAYDVALRGGFEEAYRHYRRATEIYPKHYDAWSGRGRAAGQLGRIDEAVACYRRTVEIFPTNENGQFGLAEFTQARGDLEGALEIYRRAAASLPDSYPLQYHLSALLLRMGKLAEARRAYERSVALAPGSAFNHDELAEVAFRQGEDATARRELSKALRIAPTYVDALRMLGEIRLAREGACAAALAQERAFESSGAAADLIVAAKLARDCPTYRLRFSASLERWKRERPHIFADLFVRQALAR